MSIDSEIKKIANALEGINQKMDNFIAGQLTQAETSVTQTIAPQTTTAPAITEPPAVLAPVTPDTLPPAPSLVPFNDNAGMIQYVMEVYKELGPQKGAEIQAKVLAPMGIGNINDTKPEQYAQLHAGIEAIRNGG